MEYSISRLDTSRLSDSDVIQLYTAINQAFYEYEAFTGEPYLRFKSIEQLKQSLSDCNNHFLVVKRQNAFIAGVCFHDPIVESDTLYFGMLWVAPNQRGQGLASALITEVEQQAIQHNKKGYLSGYLRSPNLSNTIKT